MYLAVFMVYSRIPGFLGYVFQLVLMDCRDGFDVRESFLDESKFFEAGNTHLAIGD